MPAETTRLFVALRPDEPTGALIRSYKRRLLAAAGPQLYATDPPHTTLYLAEFAADRLCQVIRTASQLAGQIEMPAVTIEGFHVFAGDPLTGANTLVCRFADDSCDRLRQVQLRVLAALAPLHDPVATQRALLPRWPALSGEQRRRGMLFGFPYVGGGWIPHLTIASVRQSEWANVAHVFQVGPACRAGPGTSDDFARSRPADGTYFPTLDVFELHGLKPVRLASFPLAGGPIGKVA
ncbi:MAG TPA: 2'-5' RNA ligase family protein [Pirellulaceae bacterium]|nr:2'-5' RNA ligase family protein [Pirellulaceae bacterium]